MRISLTLSLVSPPLSFFPVSLFARRGKVSYHGLETLCLFTLLQNCTQGKIKEKLSCPWWSYSKMPGSCGRVIGHSPISLTSQHICISRWVGKIGKKLTFMEDSPYSQSNCATYFILFEVYWLISFSILQLASHFLHNFKICPKHFKSYFNTIELVSFKFTMISSHLFFFTLENTKTNFSKSHCEFPENAIFKK